MQLSLFSLALLMHLSARHHFLKARHPLDPASMSSFVHRSALVEHLFLQWDSSAHGSSDMLPTREVSFRDVSDVVGSQSSRGGLTAASMRGIFDHEYLAISLFWESKVGLQDVVSLHMSSFQLSVSF